MTRHSGPPKRPLKGSLGFASCCYINQSRISVVQCWLTVKSYRLDEIGIPYIFTRQV